MCCGGSGWVQMGWCACSAHYRVILGDVDDFPIGCSCLLWFLIASHFYQTDFSSGAGGWMGGKGCGFNVFGKSGWIFLSCVAFLLRLFLFGNV